MFNILKIFAESLKLAYFELVNNRLRSFLTLLGITVGIFSIIFIFTAVDFLNDSVDESFNKLGSDVVYVQKWPWTFSEDYAWWDYIKRRQVDYEDYKVLDEKLDVAEALGYRCFYDVVSVRYRENSLSNVYHIGVNNGIKDIFNFEIDMGRYFSDIEERGSNVAVIGTDISDELFGEDVDPSGQFIRVRGKKIRVIGRIKAEDDLLGIAEWGEVIMTPHEFGKTMHKVDQIDTDQWIAVAPKEGVSLDLLKDEIRGLVRASHKIKPVAKEDFALNRVTIILEAIKSTKNLLKIVGGVLGGFSLLIGGFGVANIMFVSVKERTKYIGVKKAIGAKRFVIMLEFLIEAIFLCLLGSLIGLGLVFGMTLLGPNYEFLKDILKEPVYPSLAAFGVFVISLWFAYGSLKKDKVQDISRNTHLKKVLTAFFFAGLSIALLFLAVYLAKKLQGVKFVLSFGNIALGIGISFALGVIAGIVPAWMAARLDPVKAIRS